MQSDMSWLGGRYQVNHIRRYVALNRVAI
jgi:hypothetical protein